MFGATSYVSGMPEPYRPASLDELIESLAFALRYEGRKRVRHADDLMARITAERLVRHLARSGFVLMKAASSPAPSTSRMPGPDQAADN